MEYEAFIELLIRKCQRLCVCDGPGMCAACELLPWIEENRPRKKVNKRRRRIV